MTYRRVGDRVSLESLKSEFIGRRTELSTLDAALQRARGGFGSIFLLSGEAGIGKLCWFASFPPSRGRLGPKSSRAARVSGSVTFPSRFGSKFSRRRRMVLIRRPLIFSRLNRHRHSPLPLKVSQSLSVNPIKSCSKPRLAHWWSAQGNKRWCWCLTIFTPPIRSRCTHSGSWPATSRGSAL